LPRASDGVLEQAQPPASLREVFRRRAFELPPSTARSWLADVEMPEEYPDWWAFSEYADLLTFERDACHLARAVVLFPESPGSLAELGALAVDESIVDRLLIVVQSKYLQDQTRESFLNLGPLKRARSRRLECVIGANSPAELSSDEIETIMEFVDERLPHVRDTEKLNIENSTHKLLLIADLVDLLLVCKPIELQAALAHFRLSMSVNEIKRATDLLKFFSLIRIENRGTETFFARHDRTDRPWVNYTAKHGAPPFDRSRFKLDRKPLLDRRHLSILGRAT